VPWWSWGLVGYASVLFVAALWATLQRTRWAILERVRRLPVQSRHARHRSKKLRENYERS
jgi:hypothetical protein